MPFFYFPFFTTEITEPTEILYKKKCFFCGLCGEKYLKMKLQRNNRNLASLVKPFGIYPYLDNPVCFYHCIYQACLA